MNKFKIVLSNSPGEVFVDGDRYIIDVDMVSVLRGAGDDARLVASYKDWVSVSLVEEDSKGKKISNNTKKTRSTLNE